jgi:hypothetical protein
VKIAEGVSCVVDGDVGVGFESSSPSLSYYVCMAGMAYGLAAGWQLPNQTGANHTRLLLGSSDSTPATQNTHRLDSINCMRVACSRSRSRGRGTGVALQDRSRISCCGTLIRTPVLSERLFPLKDWRKQGRPLSFDPRMAQDGAFQVVLSVPSDR